MPERVLPHHAAPLQNIMAFDFGLQRIGVAIGNTLIATSEPLQTIHAPDNATRFGHIQSLIEQWQPAMLLIGLPLNVDGSEHDLTRRARKFANQLHGRFGLPMCLVDERYSSLQAQERFTGQQLRQQNQSKRGTIAGEHSLDAHAAQIILQQYLDSILLLHDVVPTHFDRTNP